MPSSLLIRGARQIVTLRGSTGPRRGPAMNQVEILEGASMLVERGQIVDVGPAQAVEKLAKSRAVTELDAAGCVVMPAFVDSHTHLVHAAARLNDYEMRLQGRTYAEIAAAGGGILSSVLALRGASQNDLEQRARKGLQSMARAGTTTVEAKSGYGLDEASEIKTLRVCHALSGNPLNVVPTFLGAHVVPPEYTGRGDEYIAWLVGHMIPLVARERLAGFVDIYCDQNAFNLEQSRRYLSAARDAGLGLRIHASQFANLGAVELGVEFGAMSVDHLECIETPQVELLGHSETIATLLPGSVFHLGLQRYAPARALIDAGAAVAVATDFNPGTSPTCSMPMILSLACAQMKMTPAEAITAATLNGACALGLGAQTGSLEPGKQADFIIVDASDYRELPYYFGANLVNCTVRLGEIVFFTNGVGLSHDTKAS